MKMNNTYKTVISLTGGRLANQLYFLLQTYILNKKQNVQYKYALFKTIAEATNLVDYEKELNIEKYICKLPSDVDISLEINNYYQIVGKDFQLDDIYQFINETIKKSQLLNFILSVLNLNYIDETVAIHIRNGDYNKINLYNCFDKIEYLKKSIDFFKTNMSVKHIIVISDDNDFNKNNYDNIFQQYFDKVDYISTNPIYDLFLLSSFKNKILWNSTFSFWSGFIGDVLYGNSHNVVIPNMYTTNETINARCNPNWNIIKL